MNRITALLETKYPIIQAGMIWCSGWRLASAAANAGALGVIGSGSMYPEILDEHLAKCRDATDKPFAVNVPLLYPDIDRHFDAIFRHGVKTVITSAGNPATYTSMLKDKGLKVIHVVSSAKFAAKAQAAGADAVIAEGFEAGGHNGREETTTLCLIPEVRRAVDIPVVAAGGIGSGKAMFAAMALGAEGVQIGSRFVASHESSAHVRFKQAVLEAGEGATQLTLKELTPVRMMKNEFFREVEAAYANCASKEELRELLGQRRSKMGMFEGRLDAGELEIGQVAASVNEVKSAAEIVEEIVAEFRQTAMEMSNIQLK